ncbi:MAG: hypothetical protein ACRC33_02720 [Gemmataceae bacterium]
MESKASWRDSMSLATFALSLTAVMATALFVMVGFNPKAESYGSLPWYYAAGCAVASALLYGVSRRLRPEQDGVAARSPE